MYSLFHYHQMYFEYLIYCSKNKDIKVDLEVPTLPSVEEKKKEKKEKRKAERHLVSQPKHETPPPKDPEVK